MNTSWFYASLCCFILRFVIACHKFYSQHLFFVDNDINRFIFSLKVVTQIVAQRFRESQKPHECLLSDGVDILKIRCFVNSERADSTSARGTNEHAASETFYVLEPYFSCLKRYTLVTQNIKRLYHLSNEI